MGGRADGQTGGQADRQAEAPMGQTAPGHSPQWTNASLHANEQNELGGVGGGEGAHPPKGAAPAQTLMVAIQKRGSRCRHLSCLFF